MWANLSHVEEARAAGNKQTFSPSSVYNFVASHPYPRKFTYSACPICKKSQEFGTNCEHKVASQFAFRFQLVLMDALHDGCPPLRAHVWDKGAQFLGTSTTDFATLSEAEQIRLCLSP